MPEIFKTIDQQDGDILLIDQRKLPLEETYVRCRDITEVADAIRTMVVRGAPAIGVTAALGIAQAARASKASDFAAFHEELCGHCTTLFNTRPTAVNLHWALERMKAASLEHQTLPIAELKDKLTTVALEILSDDVAINRQIGGHGAELLNDGQNVLTHCNAGALATAGHGTALGVIYSAADAGKKVSVFADETRPFLQGARLTAWELAKNGIPVTLITDNMAAQFMAKHQIDCIIVGADRIAANGDVCNKIGTYNLAVLADYHKIPFYVAAPTSTIDRDTPSGEQIPIEERPLEEVTNFFQQAVAPPDIAVRNPAFDVTPAQLVTAIITEKGILRAPYDEAFKGLF